MLLFKFPNDDSYLIAVAVAVAILLGAVVVFNQSFLRRKKLPPINPESMLFTIGKAIDGTLPDFILLKFREMGKLIRLNLPETSFYVIIGDANLARQVFEEEPEKAPIYKRFERLTQFYPSIFSKMTVGDNWDMNRKGVANSFSVSNLSKSLPGLHKKVEEFTNILETKSQQETTFDITDIMLSLTIDFIASTMFGVDFHSMKKDGHSEGQKILHEMEIASKEIMLKVKSQILSLNECFP